MEKIEWRGGGQINFINFIYQQSKPVSEEMSFLLILLIRKQFEMCKNHLEIGSGLIFWVTKIQTV